MVLTCIIVHILINKQKWVAFHKIEKSVLARLDVEKEYRKQVTRWGIQNMLSILWYTHFTYECRNV